MFIIDIDKTKAEYIRENYSIWILSLTELHESNKQINLAKTFDSRTKLQDKKDKNKVIYQYLFNQMELKLPKVNNVIIADPYILQSTRSNKSFYKNIHSLLDAILPITFIGDKIHITIITSMDSEGSFRNDTQGDYKKLLSTYNKLEKDNKDLKNKIEKLLQSYEAQISKLSEENKELSNKNSELFSLLPAYQKRKLEKIKK